jgi:hypothetical protein
MATFFGDQVTKIRAGRNLGSDEGGGKERVMRWSFATPGAGNNIGDVWVLGRLRKGERILGGGQEFHGAGGAGTFDIGTYAIAADGGLGAAVDQDAVADALSAGTLVNNLPEAAVTVAAAGGRYVAAADEYVCITNIGTAFAVGIAFAGHLNVVLD